MKRESCLPDYLLLKSFWSGLAVSIIVHVFRREQHIDLFLFRFFFFFFLLTEVMQSGAALGKKMVNKNCSALFSSDVLLSSNISSANRFHVAPGMCLYATK